MNKQQALAIFENYKIRRVYDEKSETWYFSVVDVVAALTDSVNSRDYWFKMKIRVKAEDGFQLSTICRQLKMLSSDGKKYVTDCADVHRQAAGCKEDLGGDIEGVGGRCLIEIKEGTMICYNCKTTLIPLEDRPNLMFLKDEEVEPVMLMACPKCGNEFSTYDKEDGMVIIQMPQVRA